MIELFSSMFGLKIGFLLTNLHQDGIIIYLQLIWRSLFVVSLVFIACRTFQKEKGAQAKSAQLTLALILVVLLTSTAGTVYDLVYPVVSSGRLEKSEKDFNELANGHYQINLGHRIEDVEVFFTSYNRGGQNAARINWVKHVDYFFKDAYIESRHSLNNNAPGTHTIIYRYRTPLWVFFKQQKKAQKSLER